MKAIVFTKCVSRATATIFVLLVGIGCSRSDSPRETADFAMPATDLTLAIERRSSHPYLAEYHRTLLLRSADRTLASTPLFQDTGGYSRANLYGLGDSAYVIRDAEGSYVVHAGRRTIVRDPKRRSAEQFVFIGSFDVDARRRWRFIPAAERAELPAEFQGGQS